MGFKVKEGWCKILDPNYVEEKILQGLEEKVVILNDILQIISQKVICFNITIYNRQQVKKVT